MSLQRNILASLASQVYVTLIGVVLVPLYLRYMGAEAYGLVGFFTMVQMWFSLLDVGLTPTLAREAARQRGGATDAASYRSLVRALEWIFAAVALVCGVLIYASAEAVAEDWLQVTHLPMAEVVGALQLMGPIFALRWMAGLYRGALSGAEQLVWLSTFNATVATLRFAGVVPLLAYVGATPTVFFGYQLAVAALEALALLVQAYRRFPPIDVQGAVRPQWRSLRPLLRLSMSIAFAGMVGVCITQTDKLVLSRVLPLADYAHFTLAVLVAGAISTLSGPVGNVLAPRMARLHAEGAMDDMRRVYRRATQVVAAVAGAAAITLALRAYPLLWAWTGDSALASAAAPILMGYALGNAVLALAAFPYYLQLAHGDLRLHVMGNIGFLILFLPMVVFAAWRWGGTGAALVWLGTNLLLLLGWVPVVHHRFARGLNRHWFTEDTLWILAGAAAGGGAVAYALHGLEVTRAVSLAGTLAVGVASFAGAAAASSTLREVALGHWWRIRGSLR